MNSITRCPLWDIDVPLMGTHGDSITVYSQRAGGKYRVTGTAGVRIGIIQPAQKALVTSWIIDQHRGGIEVPEINSNNLEQILQRRPLKFAEKVDRALLFAENSGARLGSYITLHKEKGEAYLATTESQNDDEGIALLHVMHKMGLIVNGNGYFELAADGWRRLDELRVQAPDSAQAFVAMWFHESTEAAYREGIHPAIEDAGYNPLRIDNKQHINKIDDEIIAEIRRSRFVVADFTSEPGKARGGVYFEAGFAKGLNIPVIWACKDSSIDDLHFDTRQFSHIKWANPSDLYKLLADRIGAVLGDGPLKKGKN